MTGNRHHRFYPYQAIRYSSRVNDNRSKQPVEPTNNIYKVKNMKKLLVIFCILILPVCSFASEKPVWVEAKGEAYLGEIDTPKEVKARARRDAQKNALEQAVGVFIKSHTLVSNSQLAEDLIYASVRGQIEKSEILHEGWDTKERSLYRVKLKSLIKPVYPEKGKGFPLRRIFPKQT